MNLKFHLNFIEFRGPMRIYNEIKNSNILTKKLKQTKNNSNQH